MRDEISKQTRYGRKEQKNRARREWFTAGIMMAAGTG